MDKPTVFYFSVEYAVDPDMPTYSAGPDVSWLPSLIIMIPSFVKEII
jgi:hypothetical protein